MYFVVAQLDETGEWIILAGPIEEYTYKDDGILWEGEHIDLNQRFPYSQIEIVQTVPRGHDEP